MAEIDALRPHIDEALAAAERAGSDRAWVEIVEVLGEHLRQRARYSEARALLEKGLERAERLEPPEKGLIADILIALAHVLDDAGSTGEAVPLLERGLTTEDLTKIERALPGVFDLKQAFQASALSPATLARLGLDPAALKPGFDLLAHLGFSAQEIADSEDLICGRMTIEGAPHLKAEHLPIFDCANRCGKQGQRFIDPMGHVRMMSAISSAVSENFADLTSAATPAVCGVAIDVPSL